MIYTRRTVQRKIIKINEPVLSGELWIFLGYDWENYFKKVEYYLGEQDKVNGDLDFGCTYFENRFGLIWINPEDLGETKDQKRNILLTINHEICHYVAELLESVGAFPNEAQNMEIYIRYVDFFLAETIKRAKLKI